MRTSLYLTAASAAAVASAQSLTDVLTDQSDTLSLFTQLAQNTGLVDVINGLDSATLFVPTNEALQMALEAFPNLASNSDDDDDDDDNDDDGSGLVATQQLVDILTYHVVPGASVMAADISPSPGNWLETNLNGLTVNPYVTEDGGVEVFSREKRMSSVVAGDITYDGGVIHTIDSVLLPPQNASNTLLDMGFTYLLGALQQTDLASDVVGADDITLFIPMNQAFVDVGSALGDLSVEDLSTILQYHVVTGGPYYSNNLTDGDSLTTLATTPNDNGIDITVEDDGALYANNARVITANILLSNGVAHLIDQIMNPGNGEDDGYDYNLEDGDGAGVPGFEGATSATPTALLEDVPTNAAGTFMPSATFSAMSGADALRSKYGFEMLFGVAAAGTLGLLLA